MWSSTLRAYSALRRTWLGQIVLALLAAQATILAVHFGGMGHDVSPAVMLGIAGWDYNSWTGNVIVPPGWTHGGTVSTGTGRFGGQSIKTNPGTFTLPSTTATAIFGCAINYTTTGEDIIGFDTSGGALISRVQLTASGALQVRDAANTVVATGTTTGLTSTWMYVELKIFVNGASGTCELHLNGVTEIASTTGNFGSTNIGQVIIRSPSNHGQFDDFYCLDTTGSQNNTFKGDVRIVTQMPDGAGAHTQWTAAGGGSNYTKVNETLADGDTSYNSDSTPGDIDTYTFADVDAGATVHAAQLVTYARKDDANTRQIAAVLRQSSTDHVGATKTMTSSYAFYGELYDTDGAGSAWTAATINGDEFGVKEIA